MRKPDEIKLSEKFNPKFDKDFREIYGAMLAIKKEPLMKKEKREILFDKLVVQIKIYVDNMSSDELIREFSEISSQLLLLADEVGFDSGETIIAQILAQAQIVDEKLEYEGKESNQKAADQKKVEALKAEVISDMKTSSGNTFDRIKDLLNDGVDINTVLKIVSDLNKEVSYPHPERLSQDIIYAQIELIEEYKKVVENQRTKTGTDIKKVL